ncbi:hypothetical protein MKW98_014234 [Papaver atlanticum]|uniref:RRM domain-containing protein n=1 Tax=Papaver atlanticum TaxID=357466 RepID=A0AAD4T863_9MAGN|nr:hypothetical protein MKW98_014234 [Papaver atlanticum]
MEESVSRALMESDFVETKVLESLIGAFSSTFSLREIASAYCKAGRAAKLNKNHSNAASVVSTAQCETSCRSSSASCEGVADKPNSADYRNSKASKGKKMAVSIGSVSGVISKGNAMPNTASWGPRSCIWPSLSETLCESVAYKPNWDANKGSKTSKPKKLALSVGSASGEGYAMRNTPAYGHVSTTEPLELDMKDLPINELVDEEVSSDSTAKEDQMRTEPGKIFVGGMSGETDEATLKDHFNKFGEVVRTNILIDRITGCSRGFGFVLFSDKSVADKVLLEKHVILGKRVDVGKVVLRGEHNSLHTRKDFNKSSPPNRKGFNKSNGNNNGQFRTKRISVGGLSPSLTAEEFKAYFEKFGRTTDVGIMYNFSTHRPTGVGFITFDSEEAVENVMQKRFHELNDKMVKVKRRAPKDGSNNGHNGGFKMRMNGGRGGSLFRGGQGAYKPNWGADNGSKASKSKKLDLSVGNAFGKGNAMRNTPAYRPVSATKPLKLDIKDLPIDELLDEDVSSDSTAKEDQINTGTGEILFNTTMVIVCLCCF